MIYYKFQSMKIENNNDSFIKVNLSNIKHNYINVLKKKLNKETKVIAVVKANAYGHGLIPVSKTLENLSTDFLGVFSVREALRLRASGIKSRILIFGIIKDYDLDYLLKYNLTPIIGTYEDLKVLNNLQKSEVLSIHLKVDTGMGRMGFYPAEAEEILKSLFFHNKNVFIEGVCTHFSDAASNDNSYSLKQANEFTEFLDKLSKINIKIPLIHASNSAAILRFPEYQFNCVRPGLLIYGVSPFEEDFGLKPALSLYSTVSTVRNINKNSFLSYNRTYKTKRMSKIAIVPLGYADGIMMALSNKGKVIINNNYFPIVGSICMNQFLVDITDDPSISSNTNVILIGKDGDKEISAKELANYANTIPYEVLCKLSGSLKRTYVF